MELLLSEGAQSEGEKKKRLHIESPSYRNPRGAGSRPAGLAGRGRAAGSCGEIQVNFVNLLVIHNYFITYLIFTPAIASMAPSRARPASGRVSIHLTAVFILTLRPES
jgi:hypothetical protein